MGNVISLIYRINKEELSLEEADKILESCIEPSSKEKLEVHENYDYYTKTGFITKCLGNKKYLIDDKQEVVSDLDLVVGSQVSYCLFINGLEVKANILNLIENNWDIDLSRKSKWCNRVLHVQVERREGRILFLTPTGLKLNLDEVSIEFIPSVGDYLELDVKAELDEQIDDLSGEIIEINSISPSRRHLKESKVTFWNGDSGTLDNKIYFDKLSFSCGYVPVSGDKVTAEIIESSQGRYNWRALKLIPEALSAPNSEMNPQTNFITKHHAIEIEQSTLNFEKLNETKSCILTIRNSSKEPFNLKEITLPDTNSQCKLLDLLKDLKLSPQSSKPVKFTCTAKAIGQSRELILFRFETFTYGFWLNIKVNFKQINRTYYKKEINGKIPTFNQERIKGQKTCTPVRFPGSSIPEYSIPKKLIELINYSDDNVPELLDQLKSLKPSLFSNLSMTNYEDRFHTLLHLEEIMLMKSMQSYNQNEACFIRNGEYLMLEIDNLSERRPSLVIGDKILASNHQTKLEFEGIVNKVGARHVYLQFNQIFHDNYKGEDYRIRAEFSRHVFRKKHHAIHLAARNLGPNLLFTSKITIKKPQIQSRENMEWFNKNLNIYQKKTVVQVLEGVCRPLPYIVFGPPGTGKTMTVVEIVLQLLRNIPEVRILLTAPSNSACDLLALRLIESNVLKPGDLIRLVSFNYIMGENIPVKLIPFCATGNIAKPGTGPKQKVHESGVTMGCNSLSLGRHKITVSTCSCAGILVMMGFAKGHFTHVVVDEAGQATEPEVMIPISLSNESGQIILAGDPMQLGPVVTPSFIGDLGLGESYLERLINRFPYSRDIDGFPNTGGFDPRLVTKLLYNYRSLPDLLQLTSMLFYNDELLPTVSENDSSEATLLKQLKDLLPCQNNKLPAIVFHGVLGENHQTPDSPSWFNPHECAQVFHYVNELYRLGLKREDIGIITPYVKQVREIRAILIEAEFDLPKIGTVEDFQGQEFNVVILSTVRSNYNYVVSDVAHSLGFVTSWRRLNVALSRAKSLLILVGNPNLLSKDIYWRTVLKYCFENGAYVGCEIKE